MKVFQCGKCNSALGFFDDNLENIKKAVTYLESYACIS